MSQSKTLSAVESVTNVTLGYLLALATQAVVFPMRNIHLEGADNFIIAGIFTVVSLVRGYTLRRVFNWVSTWRQHV